MKATEIHREIGEVDRENITSDGVVQKFVRDFKDGLTNIHYVDRSGWPSLITEDLVQKIDEKWKTRDALRFQCCVVLWDFTKTEPCNPKQKAWNGRWIFCSIKMPIQIRLISLWKSPKVGMKMGMTLSTKTSNQMGAGDHDMVRWAQAITIWEDGRRRSRYGTRK